ncbi:uncharacterized protein LOC131061914 isoform X2 [Cryptomeria japonica]|uniref:uncharacterized protein LOC131061914 isoform X2 n=1 Tax=Cryptomeria japonica TaxID=3369 RepID=UPI0027D9DA10|nr:uncharacterized protein LOC131061914 isoform X2 [Cryptomeria japonica]
MEELVNAWLSQNNHDFLMVSEFSHDCLQMHIHGKPVQLIVPSAFHSQTTKNNNSDEVFMVFRVDDESDHEFDSALILLNEKLERVKISPNCLTTVLDRIASSFINFKSCKKKAKISQNSDFFVGVSDDKQLIESGIIYKLAREAQTICEVARNNAGLDYLNLEGKPKSGDQVLFWCDVSADPASCTVQLEMELVGIIGYFHWAEALGFSCENPLKINLFFGKEFWNKDKISPEVFRVSCSSQNQKIVGACDDRKLKEDNNSMENLYGPEVLVPELIMLFFATGDNVGKLTVKDSVNQFVQLLIFVGMRLSLLPSWCVICKKELPFFPSRLCTCNGLSCLYQFQELGLGKTVLQEVQNSSELVDFEISLVLAASKSTADVFEPLQAFFPENEGMFGKPQISRDASGNKEQGNSGNSQNEHILQSGLEYLIDNDGKKKVLTRNEKIKFLQNIVKTFPPTAEMKKCADECKLRLKLEDSWLQVLGKDNHNGDQQLLKKDFVERISFPYDILRFILYTSRVKLHLLERDAMLPIPNSLFQLAVLHDSVEEGDIFHNCHGPESRSFFAFHGSSVENLYTVLRNDGRYLGRTTHMPSINLSCQLSAALGYSTKGDIDWENGALTNGFCLAAICEVISRPESFVDSTRKMVSLEDEDVSLRYVIIFKDPNGHNNTHLVDGHILSGKVDLHIHYKHVREDYKRKELSQCLIYKQHRKAVFDRRVVNTNCGSCNEAVSGSTSTNPGPSVHDLERDSILKTNSSMKTIMKEYHNLAKVLEHGQTNTTGLAGVVLKLPDENDICRWHVSLSQNLFKDHPIYKDLVEYARKKNASQACILLEITFPADYPFAPPFVRIIRPRFSRYTGHITVGGSICMELLTRSGWSPACSIESLLVQVQNAIIEGGGRLDRNALVSDIEYGETEAHEAFDRAALDHGWI